jgi:hypothetical protein
VQVDSEDSTLNAWSWECVDEDGERSVSGTTVWSTMEAEADTRQIAPASSVVQDARLEVAPLFEEQY